MASEYIKWQCRDVKPEEPVVLTAKEKRINWWYYHKWHVFGGIFLFLCLLDIGKNAFRIGQTIPDYQIAYVGSNPLPDDTSTALTDYFSALGEDLNKDGKVIVQLNQYASYDEEDTSSAESQTTTIEGGDRSYYTYASEVQLLGDLDSCDSFFFLLEDPEQFERDYGILSYTDGNNPSAYATDIENCYISFHESALLKAELPGDYTEVIAGESVSGSNENQVCNLFLARRGFWKENTCQYVEGCEALWTKIMEGTKK